MFYKKTSILWPKLCSHIILFSSFSWKTPCCQAHIWFKNHQFCQNYNIFWVQNINGMPLFSNFPRKNNCSITHILSKKIRLCYENTNLFAHILTKNVYSLIKLRNSTWKHWCKEVVGWFTFYTPHITPLRAVQKLRSQKRRNEFYMFLRVAETLFN